MQPSGAPPSSSAADLWQPAFIGLGSNLGDSRAYIARAAAAIGAIPGVRVIRLSPLYRTAPFGPVAQDAFVNAVLGVLTQLAPQALLEALRAIEVGLGRSATRVRWGPREIDLDLLVQGELRVESATLSLPHPGIPERDFVLYPLRDIAPALEIPGLGRVRELAARVIDRGIERLD